MQLTGLKINFLGDSITEGACASKMENRYVNLIAAKTGAVCRNYGIGGTRLAFQTAKSDCEIYDRDFCSRIDEMDIDANIIIVFGGTNDFGHGDAKLGTFDDNTPETFCGAVNYLADKLKEKYPDANIVFLTPLHRVGENNPRGEGNKSEDGPVLKEYVDIIKESAKRHNIPLLDLYNDLEIDPKEAEDNAKYFADGLHPNDAGHRLLADKIISFLYSISKS
ncbi:MAG: SGNH/GDSL hydrolase family protein [Acutalibacteraceae bacterium]